MQQSETRIEGGDVAEEVKLNVRDGGEFFQTSASDITIHVVKLEDGSTMIRASFFDEGMENIEGSLKITL